MRKGYHLQGDESVNLTQSLKVLKMYPGTMRNKRGGGGMLCRLHVQLAPVQGFIWLQ